MEVQSMTGKSIYIKELSDLMQTRINLLQDFRNIPPENNKAREKIKERLEQVNEKISKFMKHRLSINN